MAERNRGYVRALFKIGGSVGVCLPDYFVKKYDLQPGKTCSIVEQEDRLIILPFSNEQLVEYLRQATKMPVITEKRQTKKVREELVKQKKHKTKKRG